MTSPEKRSRTRRWANVDPDRSRLMSMVRGKNTKPEIIVRKLVHGLGFRFRLHRKDLAGTPDLVLQSRKKIIFVHGCFWHGHKECRAARIPKTNVKFWREKIARNVARDLASEQSLRGAGWYVLTVWECETPPTRQAALLEKLSDFLEG